MPVISPYYYFFVFIRQTLRYRYPVHFIVSVTCLTQNQIAVIGMTRKIVIKPIIIAANISLTSQSGKLKKSNILTPVS